MTELYAPTDPQLPHDPTAYWGLRELRLTLSWCYPKLVVLFEKAVRADERSKVTYPARRP